MSSWRESLPLFAPLPTLLLGAWVMSQHGLPARLWVQNPAAWVCALAIVRLPGPAAPAAGRVVAGIGLLLLAGTFVGPAVAGAHRWIEVGPIRLHLAAVIAPILLKALWRLRQEGRTGWALLSALLTACLLALQPDAAQATAFAGAVLVLLGPGRALVVPVTALASWLQPDRLPSVPHVEEILHLAFALGSGWGVAATFSLLLLPVPFLLIWRRDGNRLALGLAVYMGLTILASVVANYPVPLVGYGAAPVLGYVLALRVLRGKLREPLVPLSPR